MICLRIPTWLRLLPLLVAIVSCDSPSGSTQPAAGLREGDMAALSARLLEKEHYSKHPFDNEIAAKLL